GDLRRLENPHPDESPLSGGSDGSKNRSEDVLAKKSRQQIGPEAAGERALRAHGGPPASGEGGVMLWGSEAIVTSAPSGVKEDPGPDCARDKTPRSRRHLPRRHAAALAHGLSGLTLSAPVAKRTPAPKVEVTSSGEQPLEEFATGTYSFAEGAAGSTTVSASARSLRTVDIARRCSSNVRENV